MARHRKYRKELSEYDIAAFVKEATEMHQTIIQRKMPLSYDSDHHKALDKLHPWRGRARLRANNPVLIRRSVVSK